MMEAQVKKMYRVFDELTNTMEEAQTILNGWEHKEKIREVYAVGYDFTDINSLYLAPTMEDALEEMNEMNS